MTPDPTTDPTIDPTTVPHRTTPLLVERPWGGRRLADLLGITDAPAAALGEAWLAGPDTVVDGGSAAGSTLAELARRHGSAFVGTAGAGRYGDRMPLLVKLLDAAEPLSVQVHPDDAYALREEAASGHLGKDEAWLILEADRGASVLWGWRRPVDVDEVRAAAQGDALPGLLRELEVAAGDVVVNEAGVVHAVGAGVLLYEIQQASDLTYRLYDHGRLGADGAPRDLHLGPALAVARLTPGDAPAPEPRLLAPGRTRLAETRSFTLERWEVGGGASALQAWSVEERSLEVWTVLEGRALLDAGGVTLDLGVGATVVLPARVGRGTWRGTAVLARSTS
jgi:mannose-6-phosphate isomerase